MRGFVVASRVRALGRGGHQPLALAGSPRQENHCEGRAGKGRRVASGQGRRIDFQSQEDTPILPRFVGKAAGAKAGGCKGLSFQALRKNERGTSSLLSSFLLSFSSFLLPSLSPYPFFL